MDKFIKVLDHENLYRDVNTGAIINTDKPSHKNGSVMVKQLQNDVEDLKNELCEIKNLLKKLVQ
jgi:predicted transcriptional regulator